MDDLVEPIELVMVIEIHKVVSVVYEMLVLLRHGVPVVNVIEETFVEFPGGFA
jgi:hypothetical protein